MKNSGGTAAFAGAVLLLCAVVAWTWYSHVGGSHAAPQPVQQIAASASPAAAAATASPSDAPVVYVPQNPPSPPATTATASPTPPAATAAPATAAPQATAEPTPFRSAGETVVRDEPLVTATVAPHVLDARAMREVPDAPPRILSMSLSTPVVRGGDVVSGFVETTSNVASVEARIGGYSSNMQKVGVGKFTLTYRVPKLPFFLHRTYNVEIIARNTRGDEVRSSVPITIR
jgi:hypothetical protein